MCHEPRRRDHLSVAWKIPGSAFEAPIPDSRLSPLYSSASFAGKISGSNTFADEMKSNGENVLKVAVTPNPSSSYFTLEISSDSKKPLSVRVMDAAGRIVDTKLNAASKSILQVGGQLQSGIYFVEILQGSEKEMLKLVKQ